MSYPRSYMEAIGLDKPISADKIKVGEINLEGIAITHNTEVFADPRSADEKLAHSYKLTDEVEVIAEKVREWYR